MRIYTYLEITLLYTFTVQKTRVHTYKNNTTTKNNIEKPQTKQSRSKRKSQVKHYKPNHEPKLWSSFLRVEKLDTADPSKTKENGLLHHYEESYFKSSTS